MDQLQIGFIGAGRISDLHALEYLRNPLARITAVCDTDLEIARSRARAWGVVADRVFADYHDMLALDDIDAVEILLPHHLHHRAALETIAAGKHLSLQKPMALTLPEADEVVAAAAATDRQVRISENFIFYPPIQRLKEIIDAGDIGTPLSIRLKSLSGDTSKAWEVPAAAAAWRLDPSLCGGGPLTFDDGMHKFSLFWHFFGLPRDVHAWIGATEVEPGRYLDAPSIVSMRWADQRVGSLEVVNAPDLQIATSHYAQDDRIEITGTRGVAWVNRGHGSLWDEPPVVVYRDRRMRAYSDMPVGWEESFVRSTRDFIDAIIDGRQARLHPFESREILRFALAAQESARTDRAVSLS